MKTRPSHPCVLDCARSSSSLHVHFASRGGISLSQINRMEKSPRLWTNTKEDPWEPQFQRDIHKRIRLLFDVLRWQTSLCRFLANRLFVVLRPHFSHLAHVEFNNTTWAPFSPSPVTVPTEAWTKAVYLPSPDLDALSICSPQVRRNQKDVRVLVCSMPSCPRFSSQSSPSWWKPSRGCTPSRSALYAASSRCSLWCRFSSIKSESRKHSTVAPTVTQTFHTVITL